MWRWCYSQDGMRDTARYGGRSHWQRKPYRHSRNPHSPGTMRARTAPALLLVAIIASLHCKSFSTLSLSEIIGVYLVRLKSCCLILVGFDL